MIEFLWVTFLIGSNAIMWYLIIGVIVINYDRHRSEWIVWGKKPWWAFWWRQK